MDSHTDRMSNRRLPWCMNRWAHIQKKRKMDRQTNVPINGQTNWTKDTDEWTNGWTDMHSVWQLDQWTDRKTNGPMDKKTFRPLAWLKSDWLTNPKSIKLSANLSFRSIPVTDISRNTPTCNYRRTQISVSVTKFSWALLPNFNITRVTEYRELTPQSVPQMLLFKYIKINCCIYPIAKKITLTIYLYLILEIHVVAKALTWTIT